MVLKCRKKNDGGAKSEDRKNKYKVEEKGSGGQPPETDMEMNPKDAKSNRSNGPENYKDFEVSP